MGETAKERRVYPIAEAAPIAGLGLRWIRLRKLRRDRFRLRKLRRDRFRLRKLRRDRFRLRKAFLLRFPKLWRTRRRESYRLERLLISQVIWAGNGDIFESERICFSPYS